MILGLDLDGVLYPWHETLYTFYQYEMGYQEDFRTFWLEYIPSLPKEKQDYIVGLPVPYDMRIPDKETISFLELAKSKSEEIFYITYRPEELERITKRYFRRYDFPCPHNLVMTGDKTTACRYYGVTHFIDDFPSNIENIKGFADVYLMAKPWNEPFQGDYQTVHSLREFAERIF